jgi:DNA-binding MarR family transcriptional regulator
MAHEQGGPPSGPGHYFGLLNEIGIIEQLSRTLLEARLPEGLIAPHFTVLNHLTRVGDGRTPLEIARAFQVPKTSMSHTLAGLEKHGLVEMRPNPADKRSKQVWLTDQGRKVRADTIAALAGDLADISQVLSPQDVGTVMPVLTRLRVWLDKRRDSED